MPTVEVKADILGLRVVNVGTALDEDCLTRIYDKISRAIIEDKHAIIYDFSGLKEISSGEGAIFLALLATVRDYGISQAIANPQIPVRKIFNLIGITQAIQTYDSVENAIGVLAA